MTKLKLESTKPERHEMLSPLGPSSAAHQYGSERAFVGLCNQRGWYSQKVSKAPMAREAVHRAADQSSLLHIHLPLVLTPIYHWCLHPSTTGAYTHLPLVLTHLPLVLTPIYHWCLHPSTTGAYPSTTGAYSSATGAYPFTTTTYPSTTADDPSTSIAVYVPVSLSPAPEKPGYVEQKGLSQPHVEPNYSIKVLDDNNRSSNFSLQQLEINGNPVKYGVGTKLVTAE
ncbi:hypothetical protein RRG08_060616 [Elysia crispata]|uniref:Uncharacterized protein n=1 Tax=Elysia crispata TaxID=231223 RepID=A0AAE1D973_9GAST|nr:hypothetical protein RRG08_060616 [Elysia crispata]